MRTACGFFFAKSHTRSQLSLLGYDIGRLNRIQCIMSVGSGYNVLVVMSAIALLEFYVTCHLGYTVDIVLFGAGYNFVKMSFVVSAGAGYNV
jgi:hypothetical protein